MFIRRILDKEKDSSIKIIGLGDIGNKITVKLKENGCKYHTIAINPDMRDAIGVPDTKLIVGLKTNKGLGCRTNIELANECFEENKDEIESILKGNTNTYIITGSLSSTSFAAGLNYLIDIINKLNNKNIIIIASDSTDYENDVRKKIKETCLTTLNDNKNNIAKLSILNITKEDEDIIKYYDKLSNKMINKINIIIKR